MIIEACHGDVVRTRMPARRKVAMAPHVVEDRGGLAAAETARSSWKRFATDQPNERWQADIAHWRLADRTEVEILNVIDDHSRLCMASVARRVTTGGQVWAPFAAAFARHGVPAEVLTDIQAWWCP